MQTQMLLRVSIQAEKNIQETCKWDLDIFFLLIQSCLQHVGATMESCLPRHWPPLPCKTKGRSPIAPGSPRQVGGAGTGLVQRLVLALCCAESQAGNQLVLKSAQALLLAFRETTGSSTRQKARAANGEQKHHGRSCSLHCRVKFTVLLFLSQGNWAILHISLCGFTTRKLMQLKTKLYFLQWGPWLQGHEAQHQHQDWGTTLCDHSPSGAACRAWSCKLATAACSTHCSIPWSKAVFCVTICDLSQTDSSMSHSCVKQRSLTAGSCPAHTLLLCKV